MKKLIILIFVLHSLVSNACKCDSVSVKEAYKSSGIIVSITVLDILPLIDKIKTVKNESIPAPVFGYSKRVLVTKHFKGDNVKDTMIIAGENSNCELYLELGKSYLIYGKLHEGKIYTNSCTRSGLYFNHQDLKFLEKKRKRKIRSSTSSLKN